MIFTPPTGADMPSIKAWADRHIAEMNRFHQPISLWPVFADDTAAKAGKLKVGAGYVDPNGFARRVR